jgi:hypothetical protein
VTALAPLDHSYLASTSLISSPVGVRRRARRA